MRLTIPISIASMAFLLSAGPRVADAQLTVEDFPDLAPTDFSYVSQERRDAYYDEARQRAVVPFKIFDNLYYVGIDWVGSYLLVTDEGLILIDSLAEPYIELGVEHIRQLGFDPADIRYVIGGHGHFDHMGGHAYYQREFGARVGLSAADWKRAQADADHPVFTVEMAEPEWAIQDGEVLTLGDQTMRFYITPGHTEGALAMEFTVRDGEDEYRAVMLGSGVGPQSDMWRNFTILASLRRLQALAGGATPVRVQIFNHPVPPRGGGPNLYDLQRRLEDRGPSEPHPFVDEPGAFVEYLEQAARRVEEALLDD